MLIVRKRHPNHTLGPFVPNPFPHGPTQLDATRCADAFGLETTEMHRETVETFNPWIRAYMDDTGLEPAIPPLPTESIYFTNFFLTRVEWWGKPEVQAFMDAVNASGGIYWHRWGDAPIQTAALRLLGVPRSVRHLDVDYVHLSTQNRIVRGEEVAFSAEGVQNAHFRRLVQDATTVNGSSLNCSLNGSLTLNGSSLNCSLNGSVTLTGGVSLSTSPTAGPPAPLQVEGPCPLIGDCVQSPGYPMGYGNNEACTIRNVPQTPIHVGAFNVEHEIT
jgi:hypothetical protein